VAVGKSAALTSIAPARCNFALGAAVRIDKSTGHHLQGTIDEVRISKVPRYTKDFTPAERFEPDKDTLALYHFDEGQGDKLIDSSGNGHHGKIVGAKWVRADGSAVSPTGIPSWQPTPEQQQFLDTVARLKADEQIKAVAARLKAVNPSYDGKVEHALADGQVAHVRIPDGPPAMPTLDLWPLAALTALKSLDAPLAPDTELAPLVRLPLEKLAGVGITPFHPRAAGLVRALPKLASINAVAPAKWLARKDEIEQLRQEIRDFSPELQLNRVLGKLMEYNPGFDGKLAEQPIAKGRVGNVSFGGNQFFRYPILDLSPLRALPELKYLNCSGTRVSDLSPLEGMRLTALDCNYTRVLDLLPLEGMPLTSLNCSSTHVSDLSPLKGMPLTYLTCNSNRHVSDLSPLKGMRLETLSCEGTRVSDVSPLKGMPLETLILDVRLFDQTDETLLKSLPLKGINKQVPAAFWEQLAARRKAADDFAQATAALPPAEQVAAVAARLKQLNGNNIGTLNHTLENDAVAQVTLVLFPPSKDVTPLLAFTKLKKLTLVGGPYWLDISAVGRLPLEELTCSNDIALRNAGTLRAMTTLKTLNGRDAKTALAEIEKAVRSGDKPLAGDR
jgi:hypothetical protein